MRAFVNRVVPWRTWVTSLAGAGAAASTPSIPAITASSGWSGVVRTLPTWNVRPSSLARIRSVNVPPISDPTRYPTVRTPKSGSGLDFGFRVDEDRSQGLTPLFDAAQ